MTVSRDENQERRYNKQMSRATKLTRAQKIFLSKNTRLKPENWLAIEENRAALVIQHKKSGKVKTVKK